ncbi:efflux RND transporter permease subunit [Xanthovirga aplysinae]|uniref:efflux RND transporter permease subunit n=1 Tax=Xanthovirga aplysinae TaxID=2529853 RepID=UPI0012BC9830|nr:MMPL family transporter [Xanthovirga aplysinae]MTI33542.1 hypothetical protein [Xanthovirga aplysinae]
MTNYKKTSRITLITFGLLALISAYFALQINFNYDFEQYFPHQDPDTDFFNKYRERFGSDNDFVLIGITNKAGVFNKPFLLRLDSLTKDLEKLDHVQKVKSPTNLVEYRQAPLFGIILSIPYLQLHKPYSLRADSIRIYSNYYNTEHYFSKDAKSVSIFLKHDDCLEEDVSSKVAKKIKSTVGQYSFDNSHLAGKIINNEFYIKKIKKETFVFIGASLLLIIIILLITFRTFWGVILPLGIVLLTVAFILAFMKLNHQSMDLLLNILPPLMMVIGLSYVIHILTKYIEELKYGKNKINALKSTYRNVGLATFLAAITTAIGFITLTTSSVKPVMDLGLYAVGGVTICLGLCFSCLPASIYLIKPNCFNGNPGNQAFWQKSLRNLFLILLKNRYMIAFSIIPLIIFSVWGMQKIRINSFIQEDLKKNNPLKRDYLFYEKHFAGIRPFEMSIQITKKDSTIYNKEILETLNKLDQYLEKEYGVTIIYSPASIFKQYNQISHNGDLEFYKIPDGKDIKKAESIIKRGGSKFPYQEFIRKDGREARISGIMPDVGSFEIRKKDLALDKFFHTHLNTSLFRYQLTGSAVLMEKNNQLISKNLAKGLTIALVIIASIVGFVFRSVRMVGITLICNILPLFLIAAIMGFFGIDLKLSTAMIFTVAFGIAVDDTIHFISRFRAELKKGKNPLYALKRTYLSTGKAIVITSIILSGGFLSLTFSDFLGSYYIGLLTSLTLFFALLADIILLPALLLLFYNNKEAYKLTGLIVSQTN